MSVRRPLLRRFTALAGLAVLLGTALPALAANHALIMWIGDYGSRDNNLPGIDLDAQNARRMARIMGVPDANIREFSNAQVTRAGVARQLADLATRIDPGDKVFVYYSGHGYQSPGVDGARCTESMVVRGGANGVDLFPDLELNRALDALGNKAGQVVMFNDSCFSGGAATKDMGSRGTDDDVPKAWPGRMPGNSAISGDYQCGQAVNKLSRNFTPEAMPRSRVLYVAAAADNEVSFATRSGSLATLAWAACLANPAADTDRSGSLSGRELQSCAQQYVNSHSNKRQTIFLQGEEDLPVAFGSSAGSGGGSAATVNALNTLRDLSRGSTRDHRVELVAGNSSLRIGQDFLDFRVTSNRAGYLYVLQVGSDGHTFNLLYPNKQDSNNYIAAGSTVAMPRPNWRIRASGPAGTNHLLAIVTPTQRNISKDMDLANLFASAEATADAAKTLTSEATGAGSGPGNAGGYGASAVINIREVN